MKTLGRAKNTCNELRTIIARRGCPRAVDATGVEFGVIAVVGEDILNVVG